jgi:hypothetical protein
MLDEYDKNLPLVIDDPGISIGPVALGGNPLIPVVVGVSRVLPFHVFQPGAHHPRQADIFGAALAPS